MKTATIEHPDAAPMVNPRDDTRRRSRWALRVVVIMLGVAVVLWVGGATFIVWHIAFPPFLRDHHGDIFIAPGKAHVVAQQSGSDPKSACGARFENVKVAYNHDSAAANGWFVPGKRAAAVLLMPPAGADRRTMLPYLKFLHAAEFAVLMVDSAAYPSHAVKWGWNGRRLAASAAQMLKDKGFARIAALGLSEGAAAVLLAQAERPAFRAIVSDSSFANLGTMLRRNPSLSKLNPAFLETVLWEVGLVIGRSPNRISPEAAAMRLGRCALMVIQNKGDPIALAADGQAIYERARTLDKELWLAPADGHADAIYEAPAQYIKRVTDFLGTSLSGAPTIIPEG